MAGEIWISAHGGSYEDKNSEWNKDVDFESMWRMIVRNHEELGVYAKESFFVSKYVTRGRFPIYKEITGWIGPMNYGHKKSKELLGSVDSREAGIKIAFDYAVRHSENFAEKNGLIFSTPNFKEFMEKKRIYNEDVN